jgi:hypothetical protein
LTEQADKVLVERNNGAASGSPCIRFDDAIGEIATVPEHVKPRLGSRPVDPSAISSRA